MCSVHFIWVNQLFRFTHIYPNACMAHIRTLLAQIISHFTWWFCYCWLLLLLHSVLRTAVYIVVFNAISYGAQKHIWLQKQFLVEGWCCVVPIHNIILRCTNSLRCTAQSIYNIHMCGVHANSLYRSSINFTKLYGIARKIATQRYGSKTFSICLLDTLFLPFSLIHSLPLFQFSCSVSPFDQNAFAERKQLVSNGVARIAKYLHLHLNNMLQIFP